MANTIENYINSLAYPLTDQNLLTFDKISSTIFNEDELLDQYLPSIIKNITANLISSSFHMDENRNSLEFIWKLSTVKSPEYISNLLKLDPFDFKDFYTCYIITIFPIDMETFLMNWKSNYSLLLIISINFLLPLDLAKLLGIDEGCLASFIAFLESLLLLRSPISEIAILTIKNYYLNIGCFPFTQITSAIQHTLHATGNNTLLSNYLQVAYKLIKSLSSESFVAIVLGDREFHTHLDSIRMLLSTLLNPKETSEIEFDVASSLAKYLKQMSLQLLFEDDISQQILSFFSKVASSGNTLLDATVASFYLSIHEGKNKTFKQDRMSFLFKKNDFSKECLLLSYSRLLLSSVSLGEDVMKVVLEYCLASCIEEELVVKMSNVLEVSGYVRDLAIFCLWCYSHNPNHANGKYDLIPGLMLCALFDSLLNCRRAASSTIQEYIGRAKDKQTTEHIELCTVIDNFSINKLYNCNNVVTKLLDNFPFFSKICLEYLLKKKDFMGLKKELFAESVLICINNISSKKITVETIISILDNVSESISNKNILLDITTTDKLCFFINCLSKLLFSTDSLIPGDHVSIYKKIDQLVMFLVSVEANRLRLRVKQKEMLYKSFLPLLFSIITSPVLEELETSKSEIKKISVFVFKLSVSYSTYIQTSAFLFLRKFLSFDTESQLNGS